MRMRPTIAFSIPPSATAADQSVLTLLAAFVSGAVFSIGLGVSGMTNPAKIVGFLDVFGGHWDPTLGLVMLGAVAVHLPFYRYVRRRGMPAPVGTCGPLAGDNLADVSGTFRPRRRSVDGSVIAGAAVFGVGWGLGGYCPGPAVTAIVAAAPGVFIFAAAMLMGMLAFELVASRNPSWRAIDELSESIARGDGGA